MIDLLCFDLARQTYALPLSRVREVLPRATLTPLPGAPPDLAGVLRLRGRLLPVVDLRQRLGLPSAVPQIGNCIVVVEIEESAIGLLVDAVQGIANGSEQAAPARSTGLVQHVTEISARVVTVLRAEATVGAEVSAFLATTVGGAAGPSNGRPRTDRRRGSLR